ncbi:MAG: hypothetical protein J2P57_01785 [Acidimicrobiaceae bacterium]|nr:hypothetical protein [Acidimicrobiaceae bacterium]
MSTTRGPGELSEAQRAGLDERQADQDRTLASMHHLEAMLGHAAPGREEKWSSQVLEALVGLDEATAEEARNAESPDSLLSDVARTQPWLRNRVRGLRLQYRQLRAAVVSLRAELEGQGGSTVDYADVRQRLGWILTGLRHQRGRESDLIYEAYYDAFRADLPAEAASALPTDHERGSDG